MGSSLWVSTCAWYSGSAGLQAARALQPDVVFCDIGLPDIDGREVATRLRQDPAHCGVTLVALTGWSVVTDRQLSSSASLDAHLAKSASMDGTGWLLDSRTKVRVSRFEIRRHSGLEHAGR